MNRYDPDIHHRRSIRLPGYDYSQDCAYFITICTQNRECLFGRIENNNVVHNQCGYMIETSMNEMPVFYKGIELGKFIVMPNHIHAIIILTPTNAPVGATPCGCPTPRGCPDVGKSEMSYDAVSETQRGFGITASPNVSINHAIGQPQGVAPTRRHQHERRILCGGGIHTGYAVPL